MSQENVDLVRKLQPSPDIHLVELFRDGHETASTPTAKMP
jgi:hypothetical protein